MNYRGLLACILAAVVSGSSLLHANEGGARRSKAADHTPVGNIIAPGQKWHNYDDNVVLTIDKVNKANSTFAGTYGIIRNYGTAEFPFRGEFDPQGITVGWVVSYWNEDENDHALGAWAGYMGFAAGRVLRWTFAMTRIIAHEDSYNTTTGHDTFILE